MSLLDLQDVCIAIGSLTTLDLPMVVDLIGIYGLKGPYCFGRPSSPKSRRRRPPPSPPPPPPLVGIFSGQLFEEFPSVLISSGLLAQADEGTFLPVVDLIRCNLLPPTVKSQSPCDSGWSQAPVASKIESTEFQAWPSAAATCGGAPPYRAHERARRARWSRTGGECHAMASALNSAQVQAAHGATMRARWPHAHTISKFTVRKATFLRDKVLRKFQQILSQSSVQATNQQVRNLGRIHAIELLPDFVQTTRFVLPDFRLRSVHVKSNFEFVFQVTKLDRVEVQLVDPRIPESQFTYDMY
ncbi:hypothetical protein F511_26454 [Dorcoceras hygrometricum]|uniref:Uncharacterized protein n=1 Tax=Dorcoceras hygrometricum TaxID=472368 RepID=A0A2Z7CMQ8_9LAMI|nr:hypothetical protein F511_26454 [Dorcoceras hygrometricum]